MSIGTFGSFTTARLGIFAAQKGLAVTGNNIANINTVGYTRQSLDQVSLSINGGTRYQTRAVVGNGVRCVSVSQLRDPYLDIRYRTQSSTVGAMDAKLSGLDQLSSILDEVAKNDGDGVLEKMFTDLTSALDDLSLNAGQDADDAAVRSAVNSLVTQLNAYAKSLSEVKENTITQLRQDVTTVNGILTNIRDLNSNIRKSEIHGDNALELRDQRNMLIDQLSQYMKIDVTYTTEDIGGGRTVEKLIIKMGNANPSTTNPPDTDRSTLIDGVYGAQLLTPKENPKYKDPLYPDALPYLDVNGVETVDPDKAASEFNGNFDIMLGALVDANGRVMVDSKKAEYVPITPPNQYDPTYHVEEKDQYGNITKLVEHIEKITKIAAKVEGTVNAAGLFDYSSLNAANLAKAGAAVPVAQNGDVTVTYNSESRKMELRVAGEVVGTSRKQVLFPEDGLAEDTKIDFISTTGLSLGSITAKEGAKASSLDRVYPDLTTKKDTGLHFTPADGTPGSVPSLTYNSTNADPSLSRIGLTEDPLITAIETFFANNPGATATAGPIEIKYDEASQQMQLLLGDNVIAQSAALPNYPQELSEPIRFLAADDTDLGSLTFRVTDPGDTGLDYVPPTTESEYFVKTTTTEYHTSVVLDDNDLYGSLQSTRELLTEKGEFACAAEIATDPKATTKRGIPFYQKTLDALAQKLADTFNTANNVWQVDKDGNYLDVDGKILQVAGDNLKKDSLTTAQREFLISEGYFYTDKNNVWQPDVNDYLAKNGGNQLGGVLFSRHGNNNDPTGITAADIAVSNAWSKGEVRICCSTLPDAGSQANDNVLHMISMMGAKQSYTTDDGQVYFNGTFQEKLSYITTTLADDVAVTSVTLDNAYTSAIDLDTSRDSVAGVDLNDEAMGMMQYQKSYAAACRLLTTLDEVLDKLINGTGVVGR